MQGRLERVKYSDVELLEIISEQVLAADYTNIFLLTSVCLSLSLKSTAVDDMRLKEAIKVTVMHCDKGCVQGTNSHALMLRGLLFHVGLGSPINYPDSIRYYEQAIHLGNSTAMNNRAFMYKNGQGGPVDYAQAIILYDQAITLGHVAAMNNRALMHGEGYGGPVDYVKAIALFDQAIAEENASAMSNRALMYQKGQGGFVDYAKAIALYEQAIALGNLTAMTHRASMYVKGEGGLADFVKAIVLYEQAIRSGSLSAHDNLQHILISFRTASTLLPLLWDDLVKGSSFSKYTLSALIKYCKKAVLERINSSYLGTSLSYLKQLKINPQHPLTQIINNGKTKKKSAEFKKLMSQAHSVFGERHAFFHGEFALSLPPEINDRIFSFIQPGMNYDRKAAQRQNAPNDAALKRAALQQNLTAIKRLMANKPSESTVYEALRIAVEMGHLLVVKQLSSYMNLDDECIDTLCYCAQTHNQIQVITWLTYFKTCSAYRELIALAQTPMDKIRILLNSYVQSDYRQNFSRYGYWSHHYSEHIGKLMVHINNKKLNEGNTMDILNTFQAQKKLQKTDPLFQIIKFLNEIIYVAKVDDSLTYGLG